MGLNISAHRDNPTSYPLAESVSFQFLVSGPQNNPVDIRINPGACGYGSRSRNRSALSNPVILKTSLPSANTMMVGTPRTPNFEATLRA